MSGKNKKQFGVWMDSQNATIAGRGSDEKGDFIILGHVKNPGNDANSSENAANNQEIALTQKYFKEIASIMPNVDEIHVTGTGQIQEQFINYLADTPQYKNAATSESTSNKMEYEDFLTFVSNHYN